MFRKKIHTKYLIFVFLFLFMSVNAYSQGDTDSKDNEAPIKKEKTLKEKSKNIWDNIKNAGKNLFRESKSHKEKVKKETLKISENRNQYKHNLIGGFSFIETWVPGKLIATYGYNSSSKDTWEIEYTRGSISFDFIIKDLGKIVEQRISLLRRSYGKRASFHFLYGLHFYKLDARLGNDFLDLVSAGQSSIDLLGLSNFGVTVGIGNRWKYKKKYSFGIDWISLYMPLFNKKTDTDYFDSGATQDKKDDLRDILNVFESIPAISVFRLQFGYSF